MPKKLLIKAVAPRLALRPLFNRVVVEPYVEPETPKILDGIILPDDHQMALPQSPYFISTVLAVGPDCKQLKPGDRILLNRGALEAMIIEDHIYAIITEDRVYCIVDPKG